MREGVCKESHDEYELKEQKAVMILMGKRNH